MCMYVCLCVCVCVCVLVCVNKCVCVCVCVRDRGFRPGWYQRGQTHWTQRRQLQSSLTNILKSHCPSTITIVILKLAKIQSSLTNILKSHCPSTITKQKLLSRVHLRIYAAHGNGAGGRRAKIEAERLVRGEEMFRTVLWCVQPLLL